MGQNISKYVQINDFLLLEYEFSRDGEELDLSDMGVTVATTELGIKQYFNNNKTYALGVTNNTLELNSTPTDSLRSGWFNNYSDTEEFYQYFDSWDASVVDENSSDEYPHDTVKMHIISGYNFDDIAGFLLQIRAEDASADGTMVDLSNFTYIKQPDILGSADVVNFSTSTLNLGNKFYDKYVKIQIPSIYALGNDTAGGYDSSLGQHLNVKALSDVHLTYSTIPNISTDVSDNTYNLVEQVNVQLPVTSVADSFNAYIAESTAGDYIEYYATWDDEIIGQYIGDIESGRIPLYTSNNPNDNYQEFSEIYGSQAAKWILIHELYVTEHFGQSSILTQKFSFTQEDNFSSSNYFRPVLENSDIDSSYSIQYICRLSNRMDGTQIIRKASFSSTNPKKYGLEFERINVDNIIPYKVFNKIDEEVSNIVEGTNITQTKFTKIFYDVTDIVYNQNNEIYPQGTGPLYLRNGDSNYKFNFEKLNTETNERENSDLSGAFNYLLSFELDDDTTIEVSPTYSTNMNAVLGELEFKLNADQISRLKKQTKNIYSIQVKNPDGTKYTFYEGEFYSYSNSATAGTSEQKYIKEIAKLNKAIISAEAKNKNLLDAISTSQSQSSSSSKSSVSQQVGLTDQTVNEDTSQNSTAGAQISLASGKKSKAVVPSRKVVEQEQRIEELEAENLALTERNIELEATQPSYETARTPSSERPNSNNSTGPESII